MKGYILPVLTHGHDASIHERPEHAEAIANLLDDILITYYFIIEQIQPGDINFDAKIIGIHSL